MPPDHLTVTGFVQFISTQRDDVELVEMELPDVPGPDGPLVIPVLVRTCPDGCQEFAPMDGLHPHDRATDPVVRGICNQLKIDPAELGF